MRFALLLLLAIPVNATDPTVDQLVQAYAGAPWVLVETVDEPKQKFYCIDELNSRRVDWIVTKIAEHAKGASCS